MDKTGPFYRPDPGSIPGSGTKTPSRGANLLWPHMLLQELLNSEIPIKIVQDTNTRFVAHFFPGNQQYTFTASMSPPIQKGDPVNAWMVQFNHSEYVENGSHKTNTGDELAVFSAVRKLMDTLVAKIEAAGKGALMFEGTTLEPTRLKLYQRYVNFLVVRRQWKEMDINVGGWFIVTYNQ